MEVTITMHPLGDPKDTKPRRFTLSRSQRTMDIGRASKNPKRSLNASYSNALFDCPIMSRKHAQFTTVPVPKSLWISDLNSTHGTFLQGSRLKSNYQTPIHNGQTLTFGTRVMNGNIVYHAKSFRIEFSWQNRNETTSNAETMAESKIGSTQDQQDDDEQDNEDDVIFETSKKREPSIQVLESNIRTYSVPSDVESDSDLDSDEGLRELSRSEIMETAQDSNITTPEKVNYESLKSPSYGPGSKMNAMMGRSLKEVIDKTSSKGSSQIYPISIEVDEETEDTEGSDSDGSAPDVLPTSSSKRRSNITHILNDSPNSVDFEKPNPESLVAETSSFQSENAQLGSEIAEQDDMFPIDMDYPDFIHNDVSGFGRRCASSAERLTRDAISRRTNLAASMDDPDFIHNDVAGFERRYPTPARRLAGDAISRPVDLARSMDIAGYGTPPPLPPPPLPCSYGLGPLQNGWWAQTLDNPFRPEDTTPCGTLPKRTVRPDISNLIHSSSTVTDTKSLKRKADEISTLARDDLPDAVNAGSNTSTAMANESRDLHDAQPRDAPAVIASEASTMSPTEQKESWATATVDSVPVETAPVERPRKKVKVSASTGGLKGMGTFVSGVCVGIMGLAVAFMASIPASVHEEALREMGRL